MLYCDYVVGGEVLVFEIVDYVEYDWIIFVVWVYEIGV